MNRTRLRTLAALPSVVALAFALGWCVPTLADSSEKPLAPTAAQIKAEARQVGVGVRRDATTVGHSVVRDTCEAQHQLRQAGHAFHDDMHRLGHTLQHWWGRVTAGTTGSRAAGTRPQGLS